MSVMINIASPSYFVIHLFTKKYYIEHLTHGSGLPIYQNPRNRWLFQHKSLFVGDCISVSGIGEALS